MTVSERRKGLRGQQEVQRAFAAAGIGFRRLAGQGDALVGKANAGKLHLEVKRQERLQLPMWLRQARESSLGLAQDESVPDLLEDEPVEGVTDE